MSPELRGPGPDDEALERGFEGQRDALRALGLDELENPDAGGGLVPGGLDTGHLDQGGVDASGAGIALIGEAGIADVTAARPLRKDVWKRFKRNRLAMAGLIFLVF